VSAKYLSILHLKKIDLNKDNLQDLMWAEIQHFRPELRSQTWRERAAIIPLPPNEQPTTEQPASQDNTQTTATTTS